jgi:uncharacterized protein YbcC (UPF0753/DUF2309 family)
MKSHNSSFDEHHVLHELKHYLPAQAPLKDFIHHNTLHAFQTGKFNDALKTASAIFGYKVYLQLEEYRALYKAGRISPVILDKVITDRKGAAQLDTWKKRLLEQEYDTNVHPRIGALRSYWKEKFRINLDKEVHPVLFRIAGSYLDQGIAIWNFPVSDKGFLSSIREMERNSFTSFFRNKRVKNLLLQTPCAMESLLKMLVGEESLYEQYLFDQQFAHPGWSGMAATLDGQPESLVDRRKMNLHDFIILELLLEIDALDSKFGETWAPLATKVEHPPVHLFKEVGDTELNKVYTLWQDAMEWTYYDQALAGIQQTKDLSVPVKSPAFQAMFCIDDRECSLRRHLENEAPSCQTFGTPGFFSVEFFFQPEHGKSLTKLCPAPVTPKYLILEIDTKNKRGKDAHFIKQTYGLLGGWLISQTLGFWSALKLFLNIFLPSESPATVSSMKHMDRFSRLTIENKNPEDKAYGLQIGFTITEMADRAEGLLKSIGLVTDFAPIVYLVGHGASSVNNTHYAGYDCGACSGRPGSVNARVMAHMANHPKVREILAQRGLNIPAETQFLGGLHDTTRDEVEFYDEDILSSTNKAGHAKNVEAFKKALDYNAKERSRRFVLMDTKGAPAKVHGQVKLRSVSLFEPRPELNHATNALCIVGRRGMTDHLFLDRRSFLNSYNYKVDPEGKYLFNILKAAAPVCGGINLEYYFSRVDNYKLGAGTKLSHNVMGLIGVANGMDGDLRPGLPSQMIEVHDPVRIMIIVEQFPAVVLNTIKVSDATYEWFINEWVHLVVVHPETKELYRFKDGDFIVYTPLSGKLQSISNEMELVESSEDNFPVYILN